ncbi:MAG: hypothetical protein ACREFU_12935 [Acetobacteraceae bacterium]
MDDRKIDDTKIGDTNTGDADAGHVGTAHDRRRPGRRKVTNPWLIRMMRGAGEQLIESAPVSTRVAPADDLSAAKGIVCGAAVGLIAWLLLAFLAWHFVF